MNIIANNIDKNGKIRKIKNIKPGKCIFPFKYKKQIHNTCVEGKNGKWCPTSIKPTLTTNTWGFCLPENVSSNKSESSQLKSFSVSEIEKPAQKFYIITNDGYHRTYIKNNNKNEFMMKNIGISTDNSGLIVIDAVGFKINERDIIPYKNTILFDIISKKQPELLAQKMVKQLIKEKWVPYSLDIFSPNDSDPFQPVELFNIKHEIKLKKKKKKSIKKNGTIKLKKKEKKKTVKKKKEFNRDGRILELKNVCNGTLDAITYEEFEEWEDQDLKDAILIGTKGSKNCYQVENIFNWYQSKAKDKKKAFDPVNPSHEITKEEINAMKKIMKNRLGSKYKSPEKHTVEFDDKRVVLNIDGPINYRYVGRYDDIIWPFYHLRIYILDQTMKRIKTIELGYLADGVDNQLRRRQHAMKFGEKDAKMQGDSWGTSAAVLGQILKFWDKKKLLKIHHPPEKVSCCNVKIGFPIKEWFDEDDFINTDLMSTISGELQYLDA